MYFKRAMAKNKIKKRDSVMMENNGVDNTEKVPDSVLSNILQLIPTESLRYRVKYVCKRWFKIITNEILSEVAFIIIQRPLLREYHFKTHSVEISEKNGNLNVKQQFIPLPCDGCVRSSCNELLLITKTNKYGALYVYNLISKVGRSLSLSVDCGGHSKLKCGLALIYDKFRGLFKIIHIYVGKPSVQCEIFELESESLFLKRSKWRKIGGPSYVVYDPIFINDRYLYWDVRSSECILSMDIVEEKFYEIPLPRTTNHNSVPEIDGYLGLELPIRIGAAHMWILNHVGGEEWQKLREVRIEDGGPVSKYIHDIVLLRAGDYVIYKTRGICSVWFGYKQKRRDVKNLDTDVASDKPLLGSFNRLLSKYWTN